MAPGGKGANQALAARSAGAGVAMVGAVGSDPFAETALRDSSARASMSAACGASSADGRRVDPRGCAGPERDHRRAGRNGHARRRGRRGRHARPGDHPPDAARGPHRRSVRRRARARARGARVVLERGPGARVAGGASRRHRRARRQRARGRGARVRVRRTGDARIFAVAMHRRFQARRRDARRRAARLQR